MADVITLSSSEDEAEAPPKKKFKLIPKSTATIVLSDEEEKATVEEAPRHIKTDINTNVIEEESIPDVKAPELDPLEVSEPVKSTVAENSIDPIYAKLSAFNNKCLTSITLQNIKERLSNSIPKIEGQYKKLKQLKCEMKDLECMLDSDEKITYTSHKAVLRFTEIFNFLKVKLKSAENEDLIAGPKRQLLSKLEKTLSLVRKQIKKLDEAEVDFDEEENSTYIKAARYKERAHKIYKKICELRKEDPNLGRLAYTKVNFTHSKYPKINKVINRKYKNTIEFPTYFDMNKCIRNHVDVEELCISEDALKAEIKFCFEKLGNIMKQRRKLDLLDTHNDYVQEVDDPALENEEMEKKLQENLVEGNNKMQQIFDKYAKLQETGVNPDVSSDSDDSGVNDSE